MSKTRIQIARRDIISLFDQATKKVYRQKDIGMILSAHRSNWRLSQRTNTTAFIAFLLTSGRLKKVVFPFKQPYSPETRYAWGDVSLYDIMLSLKPNCYFSHYTAMQLHELTEQLPKTSYVNFEQQLPSNSTVELNQQRIDSAFRRPVRTTAYVAETSEFRICMIAGKNTGNLGVDERWEYRPITGGSTILRVTNLERTLIDIVVRPVYSGGIHEVLKAYKNARERVSVNKLAAMLHQLKFIYPYHQAIGFYLERAGYAPELIKLLRRFPIIFEFYLDRDMTDTEVAESWKLRIPKGF